MAGPFDLVCARLACNLVYSEDVVAKTEKETMFADFNVLDSHLKDSKFNPHASSYIVVRSKSAPSVVYLVFRGTQDLADMIADFNCQPREIDDIEPSFYVHGGIYETSKQSMKALIPVLNDFHSKEEIKDVIFTGHSLGGACAMAARLVILQGKKGGLNFSPTFQVVTFGAPLLFSLGGAQIESKPSEENNTASNDETWSARQQSIVALFSNPFLKAIQGECRCYVNEHDIVPRILGKKKPRSATGKSTWEEFLELNYFQGVSAASVELLPGASAGAAGVAGTGAIILSPAVTIALLSTIFIPVMALPCLLLSIPMAATTKAMPVDTNEKRKSELEVKCENVVFHAISWAVLAAKGHQILESEQLSGYFPVGSFVFLRGWDETKVDIIEELEWQQEGLDVTFGVSLQRCIVDHGAVFYQRKLERIFCPPELLNSNFPSVPAVRPESAVAEAV